MHVLYKTRADVAISPNLQFSGKHCSGGAASYREKRTETAKETLMYRTVLWTLLERERVGRFGRMALKHV